MRIELRVKERTSDPVVGVSHVSESDYASLGTGEVVEIRRVLRKEDEVDPSLFHQGIESLTAFLVIEHHFLFSRSFS